MMRYLPRSLRNVNPLRLFSSAPGFSYQPLPNPGLEGSRSRSSLQTSSDRWRRCRRLSATKTIWLWIVLVVLLAVVVGGRMRYSGKKGLQWSEPVVGGGDDGPVYYWTHYLRLNGYYNGVRTLVPFSKWEPGNRYNQSLPPVGLSPDRDEIPSIPPIDPIPYDPYPDFKSAEYKKEHAAVHECFLDDEEKIPTRDVYAYPGLPRDLPEPMYGSYNELGMREDVCFERFGRLGPYGYGYSESQGGLGLGQGTEKIGSEKVFDQAGYINYTAIDWGLAQKRCHDKNAARFSSSSKNIVKRQAYILRTWAGYEYTSHAILTLRAIINELALKSGGEYSVHLLVHIKDNTIPIWADAALYNATLASNVPAEFRHMATLWSEQQMMMYYPFGPRPENFQNMAGSNVHGVYRSAHFALQWFAHEHPEYEFFWNWEMDLRYSGHYFEFHDRLGAWARVQPRKGLWERSAKFWIPEKHGDFAAFTKFVEEETASMVGKTNQQQSGPVPVWGPVNTFPTAQNGMLPSPNSSTPPTSYAEDKYTWGTSEDADLITFNPLFDPLLTNWVFREDATGYSLHHPIPPRRSAIITVARLSRGLLELMHEETWRMGHTMFPEMWAPTVAFHHGLKAVYAPHPVYFDRDWDFKVTDEVFNYPKEVHQSVFGWGENNLLGGSFYYNSRFAGTLWRRWLGLEVEGMGGRKEEERGSGRLCLRGTLFHPIKREE